MAQYQELDYLIDDYYGLSDFEDDSSEPPKDCGDETDFEEDLELIHPKTETSAMEARNGKDLQGIPWERLNFSRDEYRETRLKQYKNFESLSRSRKELDKECKLVKKLQNFYDFQFNTRLVKSTIVHFQIIFTCPVWQELLYNHEILNWKVPS